MDVRCNGRISDGGIFRKCDLYTELEENRLNFPNPIALPGSRLQVPHMIVADDAFPLKEHIMKTNLTELVGLLNMHLGSLPINSGCIWLELELLVEKSCLLRKGGLLHHYSGPQTLLYTRRRAPA